MRLGGIHRDLKIASHNDKPCKCTYERQDAFICVMASMDSANLPFTSDHPNLVLGIRGLITANISYHKEEEKKTLPISKRSS